MTKEKSIDISAQVTPNPNTLKFVVDQQLLPSGAKKVITGWAQ